MSGKQHSAIGVTVAILLILTSIVFFSGKFELLAEIEIIIGALVGSLIVDVDSKRSKASRKVTQVLTIIIWVILIVALIDKFVHKGASDSVINFCLTNILSLDNRLGLLVMCILTTLGKMSPHRGFTHKIIGTCLFCITCYFTFNYNFTCGFILGYLLHIIADKTTPEGLKFLEIRLPLQDKEGKLKIHL